MLFGIIGLIDKILHSKQIRINNFTAHFTASHTRAILTTTLQFAMDILPKTGTLVPLNHIVRWDIAYHTVYPTVRWDGRLDIRNQIDQC